MLTKNDAHIIILERHNEWLLMIQKTILFKSSVFYTCLNVNDLMAIFCSERRDSGTKRTMKKTSRRATRVAKITTDSSLPGQVMMMMMMMVMMMVMKATMVGTWTGQ